MCYSAEASFGSGALLLATGVGCVSMARRRAPWIWPFAVIPIFFSVQQIAEGFVWMGIHGENQALVEIASRVYLFFAIGFWPACFSFAAWKVETNPKLRSFLGYWLVLSMGWFVIYGLAIRGDEGVPIACESGHSVHYGYSDSGFLLKTVEGKWLSRLFYLLTASVPCLVMTHRRLVLVTALTASVTAFAAALYFDHAFTSVWCMWSALLSVMVARSIWLAPAKAGHCETLEISSEGGLPILAR